MFKKSYPVVPATGQSLGQGFAGFEDLLDHDPGVTRGLAEPVAVLGGVAEAVGVVDAEAVDDPLVDPVEDEPVAVLEDLLILHPEADQGVDVEEPAVIQLLDGRLPVRQAIVLPFEQRIDLGRRGVDLGHGVVDRSGNVGLLLAEPGEQDRQDLLVAVPAGDRFAVPGRRECGRSP